MNRNRIAIYSAVALLALIALTTHLATTNTASATSHHPTHTILGAWQACGGVQQTPALQLRKGDIIEWAADNYGPTSQFVGRFKTTTGHIHPTRWAFQKPAGKGFWLMDWPGTFHLEVDSNTCWVVVLWRPFNPAVHNV